MGQYDVGVVLGENADRKNSAAVSKSFSTLLKPPESAPAINIIREKEEEELELDLLLMWLIKIRLQRNG